eukprot:4708043-Prymnesium_polylepis.1
MTQKRLPMSKSLAFSGPWGLISSAWESSATQLKPSTVIPRLLATKNQRAEQRHLLLAVQITRRGLAAVAQPGSDESSETSSSLAPSASATDSGPRRVLPYTLARPAASTP